MLGESTELCIKAPEYTRKDQESPDCRNPLKSEKNQFNLSHLKNETKPVAHLIKMFCSIVRKLRHFQAARLASHRLETLRSGGTLC